MEAFIHAYLELCSEPQDSVSHDELFAKCQKSGMEEKHIEELIAVYDVDQDGRISLEEFGRGTGMDVEELRVERQQCFSAKNDSKVAQDIEIINSSMPVSREIDITEKYKQLVANIPDTEMNLNELLKSFKTYLDQTYKPSWQVIIVYGSYCMKFCHNPFHSLQFLHKGRAVLVWRTPPSCKSTI